MPETGLFGPYQLNRENINQYVATKGTGVYVLDKTSDGKFKVSYVGRSDDDLPGGLGDHIGEGYHYFKYGYFKTAKSAFEKECHIYHDFKPPDNTIHPARPKSLKRDCPVADCDELD